MIKRIQIKGYKSFKELDLNLSPLMVIMGPNSSGKSNFLDALSLISRMVSVKGLNNAFEKHRGFPAESFFYMDGGIEQLMNKESISMSFVLDVELSDKTIEKVSKIIRDKRSGMNDKNYQKNTNTVIEKDLRYSLTIETLPKRNFLLRVTDEKLEALKKDGEPKRSRKPFLEKIETPDGREMISLRMEGQAHPIYYPVGLNYTVISDNLYEPHYPHIAAFKYELSNWNIYYLEPRHIMRMESPPRVINDIGTQGEFLLPFLNTLKSEKPQFFRSFQKAVQNILPNKPFVDVRLDEKNAILELIIKENDITLSGRLISEGTLRVIGLLAAVHPSNQSTLIAFEEPENGIHPVRIKNIANLFKEIGKNYKKQVIVTTHSPIFAQEFESSELFIAKKENEYTVIVPFTDWGPLSKNSKIDDALMDKVLRGDYGG